MDLKKLSPNREPIVVEVTHPETGVVLLNEDGSPMTVTLMNPQTKEFRVAAFTVSDQNSISDSANYSDMEDALFDLHAEITVAWDITYDGKKIKFTKARAKKLYEELFWLSSQIQDKLSSYSLFTKP